MLRETTQRIAPVLAARLASDQHHATVRRHLEEDRARRRKSSASRAVRSLTLSGSIRRES
jgi:hypothetical protein